MEDNALRRAVGFALQSMLGSASDTDAALQAAESEITQMLAASHADVEQTALLSVVREEIAKARRQKH